MAINNLPGERIEFKYNNTIVTTFLGFYPEYNDCFSRDYTLTINYNKITSYTQSIIFQFLGYPHMPSEAERKSIVFKICKAIDDGIRIQPTYVQKRTFCQKKFPF